MEPFMKVCTECGRTFDVRTGQTKSGIGNDIYCSEGCRRKGVAARQAAEKAGLAESSANLGRALKLIGIVLIALATVGTVLFYKFPKFLYGKNKKFLYAYIITWAVLIVSAVVYFSFFSPEAVSGIKIKTVSASCETQEQFVSILKEGLSGVSATKLEGEEFNTYAQQAHDAVRKREGEYGLKDAVYLVKLPDRVNVYVWFEAEDETTAYVYKTK